MIPILTYHQIAEAPPRGTPFRSLSVSPHRFAFHMKWLKRLGWKGLNMTQLMPYLRGERRGKVFGLTFDDGYLNNLTHAAPVLCALGFSATCYVVHDAIGATNVWDSAIGVPPSALMSENQIRQWFAMGLEVGSHTLSHAHLNALAEDQAWKEIALSKQLLAQRLGLPIEHFCYPYGEWSTLHCKLVRQAGYATATTTVRGRASPADEAWCLPRVPVHRSTRLVPLLWKMRSGHEDRRRPNGEVN